MAVKANELAIGKVVRDLQKAKKSGLVSIDDCEGLYIAVSKGGVASYVIRYHVKQGKKRIEKKQVVGRHGTITLADAKSEATRVRRERQLGNADPITQARAEKERQSKATTLKQMWERRVDQDDKVAESSIEKYTSYLKTYAWPTIGDKLAAEVTADDVVDVLTKVEARSKHVAHNVRAALSGLYRYGLQRRWVQKNPVTGLGFSVTSKPRKRRISDDEIRRLWAAIDNEKHQGNDGTKIALKLAILLGQRPGELVTARVDELDLDGPNPRYTPPATRMKRKSEADQDQHILPLSTQAAELFREAVKISREMGDGVHVFPGYATGRHKGVWKSTSFSRHGLAAALRRVCEIAKVNDLHNHDWRKAVVTWLNERGTRADVLDKILHHKPRGITGTFYDFSTLEGPMREALQRWSDHVWAITGQGKETNVVKLKKGA